MPFDEGGVDAVFLHRWIAKERAEQGQGAFNAPEVEAAQGGFELA